VNRSLALAAALSLCLSPVALCDETAAPAENPLVEATKLFEAAKFAEAADAAMKVAEDSPDFPKSRYLAGEARLAIGDAAGAETALREGLAKKEGSEPILTALGHALLEQKKAEDAVPFLEKATAANAKSARALAWLGLAKARGGKDDKTKAEGKKDLAAAAKLDPADAEVARAEVEERIDAADTDGALKAATAFAKVRKDHPMGPFLQALAHDRANRAKDVEEAIALYEKSVALDPGFLDAHKNLAILCVAQNPVYQNQERTKKALEHFDQYVKLGGKDPKVIQAFEQIKSFMNGGK
jgi:tetratricopeptide (TPR) repeat protein